MADNIDVLGTLAIRDKHVDEVYIRGDRFDHGAFGRVAQATHRERFTLFACKSIQKQALRDMSDVRLRQARIESIRTEVTVHQVLGPHDHILPILESYEDVDNVHLIMKLCRQGDLVDFILAQGVIHGDIKPQNILMDRNRVHLADFGNAKNTAGRRVFSIGGGTAAYMAPELLRYSAITVAVDVWAFGVMLYRMLSGTFPFAGAGQQLKESIRQGRPSLTGSLWHHISDEVKQLVELMLCKRPAQRITLAAVVQKPWISSGGFANGNILLNVATLLRQNHRALHPAHPAVEHASQQAAAAQHAAQQAPAGAAIAGDAQNAAAAAAAGAVIPPQHAAQQSAPQVPPPEPPLMAPLPYSGPPTTGTWHGLDSQLAVLLDPDVVPIDAEPSHAAQQTAPDQPPPESLQSVQHAQEQAAQLQEDQADAAAVQIAPRAVQAMDAANAAQHNGLLAGAAQPDDVLAGAAQPDGLLAGAAQPGDVLAGAAQPDGLLAGAAQPDGLLAGAAQPHGMLVGNGQPDAMLAGAAQPHGMLVGNGQPDDVFPGAALLEESNLAGATQPNDLLARAAQLDDNLFLGPAQLQLMLSAYADLDNNNLPGAEQHYNVLPGIAHPRNPMPANYMQHAEHDMQPLIDPPTETPFMQRSLITHLTEPSDFLPAALSVLEADIAASFDGYPDLTASERLYVTAYGSSLPHTNTLQEEEQSVPAEEISTDVQATFSQGTAQPLLGSAGFTAQQWQPLHAILPSFSQCPSAKPTARWLQSAAVSDVALSLNEFEGFAQLSAAQPTCPQDGRPFSASRSSASRFNLRRGADPEWLQGPTRHPLQTLHSTFQGTKPVLAQHAEHADAHVQGIHCSADLQRPTNSNAAAYDPLITAIPAGQATSKAQATQQGSHSFERHQYLPQTRQALSRCTNALEATSSKRVFQQVDRSDTQDSSIGRPTSSSKRMCLS